MFRGGFAGTLVLVVLGIIMFAAILAFLTGVDMPGDDTMFSTTGPRIVALVALLIVIGGPMLAAPRQIPALLRGLVLWALLGLVLVGGYAYRAELEDAGRRIMGTLWPGTAIEDRAGTITVVRDQSRQYRIKAQVNDAPVDFVFDTGASAVTLTQEDARAAGIDPETLSYTVPVSTANGTSSVAATVLNDLQIGSLRLSRVRAFVARPDVLETSLLGLSALDRLKGWRVEGDRLILEP
ncbi:TIGR02281 family clan AA aspartic protease [Stappia sp. ES.058]|uniref:retropepsin-like aspartic protease family protein n=1 Tax=Stappia sp. ES.058 TaxID=1881061 RepID=UPI00087C70EC|nr:TIGR02281 family clan AA aspartic protease [Stappia sp. ES.058]SDU04619.1 aspartyl protease family protein [Stappia sp. ES.058]